MIPCIIESPFKGRNKAEESRNRAYLDRLIRHVTHRGFSPYASHKMLVDALDDSDSEERNLGINSGIYLSVLILSAHREAKVFFGLDYGESSGMFKARGGYKVAGLADRIVDLKVGGL